MGVKHFYIWINKLFSKSIKSIDKKPIIDNLALDLNGIIHPCAQKIYNYGKSEERQRFISVPHTPRPSVRLNKELYKLVCEQIMEYLINLEPRKRLIICIDGVAGFAKMNQQRSRRFVSMKKKIVDHAFDPNCITPGTSFMHYLSKYIDWYLRKMISDCSLFRNLEIVFSNSLCIICVPQINLTELNPKPHFSE